MAFAALPRVRQVLLSTLCLLAMSCSNSIGTHPQDGTATPTPSPTPIPVADYYVAPNGDDTASGDIDHPFATLAKVWTVIQPGNLVFMRGGTYSFTSQKQIWLTGKSGTEGNVIRISAYPGETPILTKTSDYLENSQKDSLPGNYGVYFAGEYFHWKGLEITGFEQLESQGNVSFAFFGEGANHVTIELFNVHHNGHGLYTKASTDLTILNSDFHHNQDPYTNTGGKETAYGNADGLAVTRAPTGTTSTIKGCRMWWNTDDGIDLWENEGNVTIDNCWSWYNGYIPDSFNEGGNGNGYKLGWTLVDHGSTVLRTIKNSIAYRNSAIGFDQNVGYCGMNLYNNTAYRNGAQGYAFSFNASTHTARNNLSYQNVWTDGFSAGSTVDHNSWDIAGITVSDADFVSLDFEQLDAPRKADGSLPDITFLHLKPTSDLVNKGLDVDLPYNGSKPDLGAFEVE